MLVRTVILSAEYGKEGNMPQSDILNGNIKMCSILHHSKMYAFVSAIFKLQRMRVCWENCVFPSVFVHVLHLGCSLQLWIWYGSQDCASSSELVFLGVSD